MSEKRSGSRAHGPTGFNVDTGAHGSANVSASPLGIHQRDAIYSKCLGGQIRNRLRKKIQNAARSRRLKQQGRSLALAGFAW